MNALFGKRDRHQIVGQGGGANLIGTGAGSVLFSLWQRGGVSGYGRWGWQPVGSLNLDYHRGHFGGNMVIGGLCALSCRLCFVRRLSFLSQPQRRVLCHVVMNSFPFYLLPVAPGSIGDVRLLLFCVCGSRLAVSSLLTVAHAMTALVGSLLFASL